MDKFPGFNDQLNRKIWADAIRIPEQIYSLDGKRFISVNLACMIIPSDDTGERSFYLEEKLSSFTPMTRTTAAFVLLEALNGKRKTSTVFRWLSELSLFTRTVSKAINGQKIGTITLKMYLWYCAQKEASQEKLLRGALLRWIEEEAPGIHPELATHLKTTPPRKPRGMIEVQNAASEERPLTIDQVHGLLADIEELYLSHQFDPQDNLLWRLMISEALRPSQMSLLQFGDIKVHWDKNGKLDAVTLKTPIVKQAGVRARDYMHEHRLSSSLSQAVVDHIDYVESIHGSRPPDSWAIFCVRQKSGHKVFYIKKNSIQISAMIARTRRQITSLSGEFGNTDLFNRRFKHTKLTHLAAVGAPLEVLAYSGFQTSTISLARYVNLTEESFIDYENRMSSEHEHIESAFRGKIIARPDATNSDLEYRITEPGMEDDVGACSAEPCEALACLGCYGCPRFEAFTDGPHEKIEAMLVAEQDRAQAAGMPIETVHMRSRILSAVRRVIQLIKT